ncbi:MAG: BspA family leucine-rich repeat surface protein, partial [Bacteroidia bacterium]
VSSVENMGDMFNGATSFNQNIGGWIVSDVTYMRDMFRDATAFNQDISSWNVSKVATMHTMFSGATAFNQDISGWVTTDVYSMNAMFEDATAFDQNLGGWDISNISNMTNMLNNSGLSVTNYDNTIIGWEAQGVSGLTYSATGLDYCNSDTERDALIADGWMISGDTEDCSVLPVEWLSFVGIQNQTGTILNWQTQNEINNDYFVIERSENKDNWQSIAQVKAAGSSPEMQTYQYEDKEPLVAQTYYRLRQVDLNGDFSFSNVIELSSATNVPSVSVFPNPMQDVLEINLRDNNGATASLLDMNGRVLLQQKISTNYHLLSVQELPAGVYHLRLTNENGWEEIIPLVKE